MLAAVAALGLFQVMQTSRQATLGYELRALELERAQLAAEVRLLEASVAQQARLEQVHELAVTRLGMVRPDEDDSVRVRVDVPAPTLIPMPERYVRPAPVLQPLEREWWEQLLSLLPAFE